MLKNNGFHNRHSPILRAFSPLSLFSGGAPGAWYDPSDTTTLFQDSAGTTPVTAVEQPVGLMLDKSQGLVLGPELVVNGDFSNGATGWSVLKGSVIFSTSGATFASGVDTAIRQNISLVSGRSYQVTFNLLDPGNFGVNAIFSGVSVVSQTFVGTGNKSAILFNTTANTRIDFDNANNNFAGTIDNISVKELPGNHAFQATSASRPVLSARVNKLLATATLATQSVTTRATAHTLRFEGAGSVTLTGTAIGVYTAGTHSITTTAGTLTLTVLGSVTSADLRETNDGVGVPAYQAVVTSTNYATTGFLPYVRFDGVDDSLSTNSISFTSTDKMSVFAGVRKLSDAAGAILVELSATSNSNNGTFAVTAPASPASNYGFALRGDSVTIGRNATTYSSPITNTLTAQYDIGGSDYLTEIGVRVNGVVPTLSGSGSSGAGNFGNYPLFIGRRNNASLPFNGQMYSMIIVGKAVTAGELSSTETYVNQKTGAY